MLSGNDFPPNASQWLARHYLGLLDHNDSRNPVSPRPSGSKRRHRRLVFQISCTIAPWPRKLNHPSIQDRPIKIDNTLMAPMRLRTPRAQPPHFAYIARKNRTSWSRGGILVVMPRYMPKAPTDAAITKINGPCSIVSTRASRDHSYATNSGRSSASLVVMTRGRSRLSGGPVDFLAALSFLSSASRAA